MERFCNLVIESPGSAAVFSLLNYKSPNEKYRGVSSTVKLSVSKTELGGSNPSAPARVFGEKGQGQE
jgi:hypothetical protein